MIFDEGIPWKVNLYETSAQHAINFPFHSTQTHDDIKYLNFLSFVIEAIKCFETFRVIVSSCVLSTSATIFCSTAIDFMTVGYYI